MLPITTATVTSVTTTRTEFLAFLCTKEFLRAGDFSCFSSTSTFLRNNDKTGRTWRRMTIGSTVMTTRKKLVTVLMTRRSRVCTGNHES